MDDTAGMRRSGRRLIRPLKFWEFEVEEDVEPTDITYDITVLTTNTSLMTAYSHNPSTMSGTKITNNNKNNTNNNNNNNNNTQLSSKKKKEEKNEGRKGENNKNNNKLRVSSEKDKTGDGNKLLVSGKGKKLAADARITKTGKKKNADEEKTENGGKMRDSGDNRRRRSIEEKKRKMENERQEKPPGKKAKINERFDGMTMEQRTDEPCDTTMKNVNKTNCAHKQTNSEAPKEGQGKEELSVNGKTVEEEEEEKKEEGDEEEEEEKKEEGEVSVHSQSNTLKNNSTLQSQTQLELPSFRNIVSSTMVSCHHSITNLDTTTTTTKMRTGDEVLRAGDGRMGDNRGANDRKISNRGVDDTGVFKVPLCPAPPPLRRPHRKAVSFIAEPTLHSIAEEDNDNTTDDNWGENTTTTTQVTEAGVRGVSVIANNNTTANTTTNTTDATWGENKTTANTTTIIKSNTKAKITRPTTKANTTRADFNKRGRPSKTHIPPQQQQQNNNNIISSSTSLFTSTLISSTNETSLLRRSGRARIKPLEFWNFETAEVTKLETGEVNITTHKSHIPPKPLRKQHKIKTTNNTTNTISNHKSHIPPKQTHKSKNITTKTTTNTTNTKVIRVKRKPAMHPSQYVVMDSTTTSTPGSATPMLRSTLKRRRLCYPGLNILNSPSTSTSSPSPHTPTTSSHTPTTSSHTPTTSSHTPTTSSHTPTTSSHTPTTTSKQHITEEGVRQEGKEPSERQEMTGVTEREEMNGLSENEKGLVTPKAQEMKFESLSFTPFETKEYKCYLAVSYQDPIQDLYAGFIFVERGNLVWVTTRYTNLYVIEGVGKLQVADEHNKGSTYSLRTAANACIAKGKKVLLKKDGRCKTLKMFVVLTNSEENELNITQE
ncbi:hypothetical protein Pmani_005048 [Petrolisthes manimaculis]|uniref:Uncharacterized protein n=1 Tax=Petrolisthes manimaculis TaxID=1843537 RepID=A0AAE1QCW1_9EUCA|nr:hypothetical protein Pmani_005048 [Petrolisthes manimaculis]